MRSYDEVDTSAQRYDPRALVTSTTSSTSSPFCGIPGLVMLPSIRIKRPLASTAREGSASETEPTLSPQFFTFVQNAFGTSLSWSNTLVSSTMLALRKHFVFQFCLGARPGSSPPSKFPDSEYLINAQLLNEKAADLYATSGMGRFVPNINYRIMGMLAHLKQVKVPKRAHPSGADLDRLVNSMNLSPEDLKSFWLENTKSCSCSIRSKQNDLLRRAWVECYAGDRVKKGFRATRSSVLMNELPEKDLLSGMFRLALEIWSLDFDVIGGTTTSEEIEFKEVLESCFRERHSIPPTMMLLTGASGEPVSVIPRRTDWSEFVAKETEEGFSRASTSSSFSDEPAEPNESGVEAFVDGQMDHPYVRYKVGLLIERGYSPQTAEDLMRWSLLPPNFTPPFEFLLVMLSGIHRHYGEIVGAPRPAFG
jgi:hypothetical protein